MRGYRIDKDKCRGCLKCVQACPVGAVELQEGRAAIRESRCVDCGICYGSCGHGAICLDDQVEAVKGLLAAKRKVILSIDPACGPMLPEGITLGKLAAAAQGLGVWDVADASEAVAAVSGEYARLLREKHMEVMILTGCPVVRNLVESRYPELVGFLAPVASPMIAHGRMLKRDFTSAAVVYVATCGARIQEARDVRHSTEINGVLTLGELLQWLEQAGIDPRACREEPLLSEEGGAGRAGAAAGGLLRCMKCFLPEWDDTPLQADGMDRCLALLEGIKQGYFSRCVAELMACPRGCVGGPAGGLSPAEQIQAAQSLLAQGTQECPQVDLRGIAMANPAIARPMEPEEPEEEEILEILYHTGVGNPRQQKNCGKCGFATCRDRAAAIARRREPVSLCPLALEEQRRDVYARLYEALPMAAILVDDTQRVVGLNREARSLFSLRPEQEKYIFELMDPGDFQYVLDTGLSIQNRPMDIPEIYMRVEASLVPLKELKMVLGLFRDITQEEEDEAQRQQSRLQSVEMAQKVIEKQMTVAQQIAYLLGETTAETKVTLNRLKERILGEEDKP